MLKGSACPATSVFIFSSVIITQRIDSVSVLWYIIFRYRHHALGMCTGIFGVTPSIAGVCIFFMSTLGAAFFILSTAVTRLSTALCLEHINIFDSCKIIAAVLVCEHGISPHCGAYTFAGGVCFVKA